MHPAHQHSKACEVERSEGPKTQARIISLALLRATVMLCCLSLTTNNELLICADDNSLNVSRDARDKASNGSLMRRPCDQGPGCIVGYGQRQAGLISNGS